MLKHRFYLYAKEKLTKFYGVKPQYTYLYLKELEFRFNNQDQNISSLCWKVISQYERKLHNEKEMAKSIEEKIDFVLQTLLKDARAILQGQKDPENPNGWEMVKGRDKPCGNWHFITERAISLLDLEPETKEKIQKRLATVFPKVFS